MTERGYPTLNLNALIEPPKAGFWGTDERTAGTRTAVRIVRNGDVAKDGYIPRSSLPVRWVNDRERDAAITLDSDCILVSSGAYTGVTGKVLDDTADDLPVIVSNFVRRVRPLEGVDPAWLFHSLRSAGVQAQIWPHTGGSAMPNLNRSFFEHCVLPAPKLAVQGRIAEILDTVDDAIRSTERLVAKLVNSKEGLLQDLMTRGINDDGTLRDPSRQPTDFSDTLLGPLPSKGLLHDLVDVDRAHGRTTVPLGDVLVAIEAGWTPPSEDIAPSTGEWGVLKVSAVSGGSYAPAEAKRLAKGVTPRAELEVMSGDVLLARANGVADLVATVAEVLTTPSRLTISDKTLRIVPQQTRITGSFMTLALQSASSRRQVRGLLNGSSGQQNISQTQIRRIRIALPPLNEQVGIVNATRTLEARLSAEHALLAKLQGIKRGLMDDLLTGRVRVPVSQDAA
jgi:type I restriction enzyme, S subunit